MGTLINNLRATGNHLIPLALMQGVTGGVALAVLTLALMTSTANASNDVVAKSFRLFQHGKKEQALILLREAVRSSPTDLRIQSAYQHAMMNLNRWDELEAEYKSNLAMHPGDGNAYYLYATAIGERDNHEFRRIIEERLRVDKAHPWLMFASRMNAAVDLIRSGKPDEALSVVGRAENALIPADAYRVRSLALESQFRFEEAYSEATRALEADPWDSDLYIGAGDLLFEMGSFNKALSYYRTAVALRESAQTLESVASGLLMMGKMPEAKEQTSNAVHASSATILDKWALSQAYSFLGLKHEALVAVREADKKVDDVGIHLAAILAESAISSTTLQEVEMLRLLVDHPTYAPLLVAAGYLYAGHNQFEQGLEFFNRLVMLNKRSAEGWQGKAYCEASLGREDDAMKAIDHALRLVPMSGVLLSWKGDVSITTKNYDAAAKAYTEALKISPEDGPAALGLCKALVAKKKGRPAVAACKEAVIHSWDAESKSLAQQLLCESQVGCAK